MKMFGVKELRTTGYNPRANGLTEKGNEFIKNYLASYVNYSDKEWDLWCREASCAYKSRVHSSTGFTPAKLMFGRDYRVPIDIMYNVRNDDRKFSSIDEYERTLQDLYNVARESLQARQAAAATCYDKKIVDDELQVGELVCVLAPRNKSKKLALKWFGPSKRVKCYTYVMHCAIWYHLYNFKNVKNTHGHVTLNMYSQYHRDKFIEIGLKKSSATS